MEGRRFVGERKYRRKDGALLDLEASAVLIPYHGGETVCAVVRDVTERRAFEEQLRHQAFHDPLTGLPNRALFLDRLEHALVRSARNGHTTAVFFLDLDRFKVVNDSLGHEAGDDLLVAVAGLLAGCLRPEDTVARLGGDEFTVLVEEVGDVSDAVRMEERIARTLDGAYGLGEQEVFVSTSVGIALSSP